MDDLTLVPAIDGVPATPDHPAYQQAVDMAHWARLAAGRAWTDAPNATPLADLKFIQLRGIAYGAPLSSQIVRITPHQLACGRYRVWWRALPRRDKRALRRRGLTAVPC